MPSRKLPQKTQELRNSGNWGLHLHFCCKYIEVNKREDLTFEQTDQVGAEGSRISLCNISETIYWIFTQSAKGRQKGRACQCFPPKWSCWVFYSWAFCNTEDACDTVLGFPSLCISLRQTLWVFLISKGLKGRNPELLDRGCAALLPWSAQDVRKMPGKKRKSSLSWIRQ